MACFDLDAYFARLGYTGPASATLATLQTLHALHPATIAFENLDILLKRPIRLDLDTLTAKLVKGGRGGYCYEHNTLFQAALQAIGFSVSSIAARVQWRYPEGSVTPRYHMLLRIDVSGEGYIADVGFGLYTLTAPLRLSARTEQPTPHALYRLVDTRDELRLEAKTNEGWAAVYQMSLQEQNAADWEVANWYTSTSPDSRFITHLMAARAVGDDRYGLLDNVLSKHRSDGAVERQIIETPEVLLAILRKTFGIDVPADYGSALAGIVTHS